MADETRILVLEGPLSQGVAGVLATEGWSVIRVAGVSQMLSAAEGGARLIILDALAPGMDPAAWKKLAQRVEAPVLVIVPGLEAGGRVAALRAPFAREALLERVQELLAAPPCVNLSALATAGRVAEGVSRPRERVSRSRLVSIRG